MSGDITFFSVIATLQIVFCSEQLFEKLVP